MQYDSTNDKYFYISNGEETDGAVANETIKVLVHARRQIGSTDYSSYIATGTVELAVSDGGTFNRGVLNDATSAIEANIAALESGKLDDLDGEIKTRFRRSVLQSLRTEPSQPPLKTQSQPKR